MGSHQLGNGMGHQRSAVNERDAAARSLVSTRNQDAEWGRAFSRTRFDTR